MLVVHFSFISLYIDLYARAQFRTPRVTYSVQFHNGGFWLNGQNIFHTVSLNFQRVVPVSYGFYVASHSFLRVELMCFSLCNDWKTPKFGPSEFEYTI
jgi:adenosylcobinamide amidohydrolase